MSTEEPRDPSGLSGETMGARPEKTNWKPVYAAIAVVVALSIITVLWINRPETQVTNPPPSQIPSPSQTAVPTPTPSPSPSPSPTLDEREVAVAEAKEAYQSYVDAYWVMARGGSTKTLMKQVEPYTSGRNWKAVQREATEYRKEELTIKGKPDVIFLQGSKAALTKRPPIVTLNVCINETQVDVTDNAGNRLNPDWIRSKATMIRDGSSWQLDDRDDEILDESCVR